MPVPATSRLDSRPPRNQKGPAMRASEDEVVKPSNLSDLRVGDYIEIPSWDLCGRTLDVRPSVMGSQEAVIVLIQEYPDQPLDRCQRYRLEPGQWRLLQK